MNLILSFHVTTDCRTMIWQSQSRNMHLKFSASRESERANNQGLLASCNLKLHKAVQVNAWLHTNNDARCASYGTHTYTPGLTEPRGHASPLYQLRGADYAQQITTCSPHFKIFLRPGRWTKGKWRSRAAFLSAFFPSITRSALENIDDTAATMASSKHNTTLDIWED